MDHTATHEHLALNQLMNQNGGIDADMVDAYFHSPVLMKSLFSAVQKGYVIWDEDRIHIKPNLFFAMITGVAF